MADIPSYYFLTIHPDFISAYSQFGVFGSATKKKLAKIETINLRDFAVDKHGTIDGPPYGGGDGMVLRPEPIADALKTLENPYVVMASPVGVPWTQELATKVGEIQNRPVVMLCGRFGGVDQRVIDQHVDLEVSMGDFIVSGGELPSLMMVDSVLRFIPGVLGNTDSFKEDSFSSSLNGGLEHALYTRPAEFSGKKVPDVLMSGDHKKIEKWKEKSSLERTAKYRKDLS